MSSMKSIISSLQDSLSLRIYFEAVPQYYKLTPLKSVVIGWTFGQATPRYRNPASSS